MNYKFGKIMHKTQNEWITIFSQAKHGHILWDGNAENPYDPKLAYEGSFNFVNHASVFGFFQDGHRILDLGCGNGRFCIALSERNVTYEGIDPMMPCIEFCKNAFFEIKQFNFQHADIYNSVSNPSGIVLAQDYMIPFPNNHFDDVICYSVLTHLEHPSIADHYLTEIKRVLKPNGRLFVTCYRSPPDPNPDTNINRTVHRESDIMNMLDGFKIIETYGGHTGKFYDQWALFCQKRSSNRQLDKVLSYI